VQPSPLQLPKVYGGVGLAVRVTISVEGNWNVHVLPQLMPGGLLVTEPFPLIRTVRVLGGGRLNVAITVWALSIVTIHVNAVPEQPPPFQPANVEGEVGLAVRVTDELKGKFA
jgi:hypothetical protein